MKSVELSTDVEKIEVERNKEVERKKDWIQVKVTVTTEIPMDLDAAMNCIFADIRIAPRFFGEDINDFLERFWEFLQVCFWRNGFIYLSYYTPKNIARKRYSAFYHVQIDAVDEIYSLEVQEAEFPYLSSGKRSEYTSRNLLEAYDAMKLYIYRTLLANDLFKNQNEI